MRTCLEHLSSASPSYRRMASTFYTEIGKYSKKSFGIFQWIITRLLGMCYIYNCEIKHSESLNSSDIYVMAKLILRFMELECPDSYLCTYM